MPQDEEWCLGSDWERLGANWERIGNLATNCQSDRFCGVVMPERPLDVAIQHVFPVVFPGFVRFPVIKADKLCGGRANLRGVKPEEYLSDAGFPVRHAS